MRKMEERKVEVLYCDDCGKETKQLEECAICKREMCTKDGGAVHFAFSTELYRFDDGQRLRGYGSYICHDCAGKKFDVTIGELLNGMMTEKPVPLE